MKISHYWPVVLCFVAALALTVVSQACAAPHGALVIEGGRSRMTSVVEFATTPHLDRELYVCFRNADTQEFNCLEMSLYIEANAYRRMQEEADL